LHPLQGLDATRTLGNFKAGAAIRMGLSIGNEEAAKRSKELS
jgi:hypothetical protein